MKFKKFPTILLMLSNHKKKMDLQLLFLVQKLRSFRRVELQTNNS
jgi:hypothetical protein